MFSDVSPEQLLRDRLIAGRIARAFFDAVLEQARERKGLSSEHFTVDGTLIEAWASHKSFQPENGPEDPKDGAGGGSRNATISFHGERRLNETHASTTDPESRLFRKKGKQSKLAYRGHALTENRHGLVVAARLTQAMGHAINQRRRKPIEEVFGWMKTIGLTDELRHRGREKIDWTFRFTAAAYDLVRLRSSAFAT